VLSQNKWSTGAPPYLKLIRGGEPAGGHPNVKLTLKEEPAARFGFLRDEEVARHIQAAGTVKPHPNAL